MSGAVAAHAAYNGSGTQGLAVTNKISGDDGDVMSVFWNENDTTRQLLYGSSIIEIPASGSGGSLSAGGNQFFTVNNDIDALGDLYLQITTDAAPEDSSAIGAFALLDCIKRIEFMVGTQVWQTLESADIGSLNATEMSEDAYESFFLAMSGGFNENQTRNSVDIASNAASTDVSSKSITGVLRIPALSRSVGPKFSKYADITENSYLLAGAPNQTVKIKVYMASKTTPFPGFTLKLFGQCIVMCNDEREQIKTMPMGIPKRLKMTQNSTSSFVSATTNPADSLQNVICKMDLDHFSLYASHIILVINGKGLDNSSITDVELKLNSSSFSGVLQGALLTGPAADALGLFSNGIYLDTANYANNYYVFPLASKAYGASSVPLNRFDNIRLEMNVAIIGDDEAFSISATCVGETTALYKGGAASLAMY